MLGKRFVKALGLFFWTAVFVISPLPLVDPSFGDDMPLHPALPALESKTPAVLTGNSAAATGLPSDATKDETFVVLCYHRFVLKSDETDDWAQAEYQMPVEDFKWQMEYLKENGFTPISEGQLMDFWFRGKPLPPKPVLITFDDGFRTIYWDAFPVMKSYGYPSIFFLYTKFIENRENADKRRKDLDMSNSRLAKTKKQTGHGKLLKEALKISEISSMQNFGMIVESHTANHLNLGLVEEKTPAMDYRKLLEFELSEPLTFIQSEFNRRPELIAYPYGVYDPTILEVTRAQGYKLAFTVNPGPNDRTIDPLKLKRELILNPISHKKFASLFTDKVLHMKGLFPGDGEVIETQTPVITAQIEDDVVPGSVQLQMGNHIMPVHYESETRTLSHQVGAKLAQGGHILTLRATDIKGVTRVYNWYFRIKHKKFEKEETDKRTGIENTQN